MIWTKTEAGRAEMQSRARLADRSQRMLLLLIDGVKTEEMLLTHVTGITPAHFLALRDSGLIEPVSRSASRQSSTRVDASMPVAESASPQAVAATEPAVAADDDEPFEFARLLGEIISRELGLRGASLAHEVEGAETKEALDALAHRVIWQLRQLKGNSTADKATRQLFG